MKIIAFVGPLGSGKTKTVLSTMAHLIESKTFNRQELAFLLNDEGSVLDGEAGIQFAQVIAITNGCFTCGDAATLRDQLGALQSDGVKLVLMEGLGMTGGDETVSFLKSTPYPFQVVTTLDYQSHWENLSLYEATIASHLEAATLGILVTKTPSTVNIFDLGDSPVGQFVAKHNRNSVPVMIQRKGEPLPGSMLTKALTSFGVQKQKSCTCCHHHSHNDGDEHLHGSAHDFHLYSFELNPKTTLAQIKAALQELQVIRAKGATEGRRFNLVQSNWTDDEEDKRFFLTFYTRDSINLSKVLPLTTPVGESFGDRKSYQLMRSFKGDPTLLLQEIHRLIDQIPVDAKMTRNGTVLITHPEALQLAKDLSRCPVVKDEQFPKTLNVCLRYWLKALALLRSSESKMEPKQLCVNKVELAASIAWWVTEFGDKFDEGLVSASKGARIGILAAEGAVGLRSLNEDPEKAFWQCKELERAFQFGIQNGDQTEPILQAIEHCQRLSMGTSVEELWGQIVV